MKKVTQTNPESHDFHTKVKASVGSRGTAHSIATKNTGGAINGKNSHMRGRTGGGLGGNVAGAMNTQTT